MEETCCPPFEPGPWDAKTITWEGKRFVKDSVFCLFYMPVRFGRTMARIMERVEQAKAQCVDGLCLSEHTSKWNMDVYVAVDKDIQGLAMHTLSGRFLSKVYEGPFRDSVKWCADFADYAKREGAVIEKQYMWYTTCPKCAKARGKNYVVVLGKMKSGEAGTNAAQPAPDESKPTAT